MRFRELAVRQWIARRTAKMMFALALAFLFCQAVLVVLWADVPLLVEIEMGLANAETIRDRDATSSLSVAVVQNVFLATSWTMIAIWPIVAMETIFHWLSRPWDAQSRRYHWFGLLFCACPSLRMCARSPELRGRIWLPGLGWRTANKRLRVRLERQFSVPMISIALLIMPVLIVDFFMQAQVHQYAWLRLLLHVCTGVIWFAFAAEFVLMCSVAKRKLQYCRTHWIDIAIILLPFISFLRSLRVLRASRAVNLLRVSQITKIARVYRLRGTAVKALRALVLLELFHRITGGHERTIERLKARLAVVEAEASQLRRKINRLQLTQRELNASKHDLEAEADLDDPPNELDVDRIGPEAHTHDAVERGPRLAENASE